MLPADCTPVLVTDAGFRRPWFQAVEAKGWHYVGRIRNRDLYRTRKGAWESIKTLYARICSSPKALGQVWITQSKPHRVSLYGIDQTPKGRKGVCQRAPNSQMEIS
ncbi:hypothetical protein J7302_06230 [Pseudomonas sp. DB1]|uniref:Transposase IS4-like domain-containing protein n=1 Tax=Metapseudomonas boanensis TaxID=2822138 RepID=A0ABS5XDJ1_9GAMM|nr:hypothetical protein [Pseudomonas boanensis]